MLPGSLPDQRIVRAVARRAGAGRPPEAAARPERGRARRRVAAAPCWFT